jgi:hypothetical protein
MSESRQPNLAIQTNTLNVKYSEPGQDEYSTNSTSKQLIDGPSHKVYPESPKTHRPALDKNIAVYLMSNDITYRFDPNYSMNNRPLLPQD